MKPTESTKEKHQYYEVAAGTAEALKQARREIRNKLAGVESARRRSCSPRTTGPVWRCALVRANA